MATVAIGNAANAGLLAARILATSNPALQQRILDYQVHHAPVKIYGIILCHNLLVAAFL